jgi:hypothetical protein
MRAPRHVGTIYGYAINKRTPALLTSQTGSARDRQHHHHSPVAAAHSAHVQPAARPDERKNQLAAMQCAPPGVQPAAWPDKRKASQPTATQTPLFRASNSTASKLTRRELRPASLIACDSNSEYLL